jgi:predicted transcriptional regulator
LTSFSDISDIFKEEFVDDIRMLGGIKSLAKLLEKEPKCSLQLVYIIYHLAAVGKSTFSIKSKHNMTVNAQKRTEMR